MVRFVGILQKRCAPGPKPLRRHLVSSIAMLLAAIGVPGAPARAGTHALTAQLQRVLDSYVAERGQPEGISGVALQVDFPGLHAQRSAGSGQPLRQGHRVCLPQVQCSLVTDYLQLGCGPQISDRRL